MASRGGLWRLRDANLLTMTAGYSGTPLAKKLTLRDEMRVHFDAMPESIQHEISEYGIELNIISDPGDGFDAAHVFVRDPDVLATKLLELSQSMARDGQIWVSWPKKGSGEETELDQAAVQRIGIESGLVDIKKCAVDHVWSGLKFVIPKANR